MENTIEQLSTTIVDALKVNHSVFVNVQIAEELSQYDVLFSWEFINIGSHQRGILANDIIISIIGHGAYGFRIGDFDTDIGYYAEKLNAYSEYLTSLFNEVRKKLKKS